jgi:hypothetical protein
MSSLLQPLHLLLMMFAGWINRHQLDVIDYLREENRLLKERLGGHHIRFTDTERRRLARKAYALGRKALNAASLQPASDAATMSSPRSTGPIGKNKSSAIRYYLMSRTFQDKR